MSRSVIAGIAAASCMTLTIGAAPAHAEPAVALLPGNQIVGFDTNSPGTIQGPLAVTGLGSTQTLRGIDFRPATGQLFGTALTTASAANSAMFSYAIDPATGQATLVGSVPAAVVPGAADIPGGYDFNPALSPITGLPIDRMRYVNTTNFENARLNPTNGVLAGDDTNITPPGTGIIGLAYDRNTSTSTQSTVYVIDRDGSRLGTQGGLNGSLPGGANGGVVTDLGSLGVALDPLADAGFDISPTGAAYAALTAGGVTQLYRMNLAGGPIATPVGPIGGGGVQVYSLAVAVDTDGDGFLFAADNCPVNTTADQADLDVDGAGDACDADDDGDGLSDDLETAIGSDPRSTNTDGDGVPDGSDACPTLPGTLPDGCPDIALPDTKITKGPKKKSTKRTARLKFESTEAGSTFACSLDDKAFKPCTSPQKYKKLEPGKHTFEVRAIDPAKNLDPTPASRAWTVKD